jgi:hypothetical protein
LLEEVALSPVMGIYLSHMRNRKEDPATGRVPDENFAREVMQLFSIGLVELNPTARRAWGRRPPDRDLRQRRRDGAGEDLHRLVLGLPRLAADREPIPLGLARLQPGRRHAHRPAEDEVLPRPVLHRRGAAVCRQAHAITIPPGRTAPRG